MYANTFSLLFFLACVNLACVKRRKCRGFSLRRGEIHHVLFPFYSFRIVNRKIMENARCRHFSASFLPSGKRDSSYEKKQTPEQNTFAFLLCRGRKKMSKSLKKQDCSEMRDNDGLRFMPEALNLFFRKIKHRSNLLVAFPLLFLLFQKGTIKSEGVGFHRTALLLKRAARPLILVKTYLILGRVIAELILQEIIQIFLRKNNSRFFSAKKCVNL